MHSNPFFINTCPPRREVHQNSYTKVALTGEGARLRTQKKSVSKPRAPNPVIITIIFQRFPPFPCAHLIEAA